jgi:hypothetical protein
MQMAVNVTYSLPTTNTTDHSVGSEDQIWILYVPILEKAKISGALIHFSLTLAQIVQTCRETRVDIVCCILLHNIFSKQFSLR